MIRKSVTKVLIPAALAALSVLSTTPGWAADIQKRSLKMPIVNAITHPQGVGAKKFADLVEQKSDGKIKIKIFAGGTLGGEVEVASMMQGGTIDVSMMAPAQLVGNVKELALQRKVVDDTAKAVFAEMGARVDYLVGTMIELPRAALTADEIAAEAEFFSFGTNDLTQTALGLSRDDAGRFLPYYVELGIYPADPFARLDQSGVGQLVRMGFEKGRSVRGGLKVGICGEHGGDPSSVEFCDGVGLNYVSCSPYRVPVARLAAAHAVLKASESEGASSPGVKA